jgi:hypothetical protein
VFICPSKTLAIVTQVLLQTPILKHSKFSKTKRILGMHI